MFLPFPFQDPAHLVSANFSAVDVEAVVAVPFTFVAEPHRADILSSAARLIGARGGLQTRFRPEKESPPWVKLKDVCIKKDVQEAENADRNIDVVE